MLTACDDVTYSKSPSQLHQKVEVVSTADCKSNEDSDENACSSSLSSSDFSNTIAIGDSVMEMCHETLESKCKGITVNAVVSRHLEYGGNGANATSSYPRESENNNPPNDKYGVVDWCATEANEDKYKRFVIGTGNNDGGFDEATAETMVTNCGNNVEIWFITQYVSNDTSGNDKTNKAIEAMISRHDNVHKIDWAGWISQNSSHLADNVHPGDQTAMDQYATLIHDALSSVSSTSGKNCDDDNDGSISGWQEKVIEAAKSKLGGRYVWGGHDYERDGGLDCSGFTAWCYSQVGVSIVAYSEAQKEFCTKPISEAEPGDVVYKYDHVGIYIGDGKTIEAHSPAMGIDWGNANNFQSCGHPLELDSRSDSSGKSKSTKASSSSGKNAAISSSGKVVGDSIPEQIWNYCRAAGFSEAATAAIIGNGDAESNFDSNAIDGTGLGDSIGIWQFTNEEKYAYLKWSNNDLSLEKQLDWMFGSKNTWTKQWMTGLADKNFYGGYGGTPDNMSYYTIDEFKQADDIAEATYTWMSCYERPSAGYCNYSYRLESAKKYYEKFTGKSATASSTADDSGLCDDENENDTDQ